MNADFRINGKSDRKQKGSFLDHSDKPIWKIFYEYASVEGVGEMAGWKHHEKYCRISEYYEFIYQQ